MCRCVDKLLCFCFALVAAGCLTSELASLLSYVRRKNEHFPKFPILLLFLFFLWFSARSTWACRPRACALDISGRILRCQLSESPKRCWIPTSKTLRRGEYRFSCHLVPANFGKCSDWFSCKLRNVISSEWWLKRIIWKIFLLFSWFSVCTFVVQTVFEVLFSFRKDVLNLKITLKSWNIKRFWMRWASFCIGVVGFVDLNALWVENPGRGEFFGCSLR
jgi:hypothetical protein